MAKITEWNPEDEQFWASKGKKIANKNLYLSVYALILAFIIWQLWSVVAVRLNDVGFDFTSGQLFTLAALPGLTGATFRLVYTFLPGMMGGKKTTLLTTGVLLIPAIGIGFAVQNPETSFMTMAILAAFCGLGGGNLASSTSALNPFYPKKAKGTANGINVGIGNLGVSVVQFLTPIVIGFGFFGVMTGGGQVLPDGSEIYIQNAAFIWVIPIVLSFVLTLFFMDELPNTKQSVKSQLSVLKLKHTWIMAWLYIMCFGSFIGFGAAFPLIIDSEFSAVDGVQYAFLGPLIGAALRPAGGWLSDKVGSGASVTFWTIIGMVLSTLGILYFLNAENFIGFLLLFILLFAGTGIANGSTFRMVPFIFEEKQSAPVMGLIAAFAAYGAYFIPEIFGTSIDATGSANIALYIFVVYYLVSLFVCWFWYSRKNSGFDC
ncbi:MFS transporter [Texcoconibacillus texcoconensis]|uniref:NNP family nitrate/nitrite transporter-like MFS transporter n=1 Tax=Texcoconibacillus texcoconensis TaxID=1095777 RepID=A0A840QPN0_9BACI|nr:MFS transporter [Texcoconibacillus texcoconensis]MBB5173376.1 NNP family nitrate/nitrite transporter-like MFS transporter [Texcoconibacillus texcoconensis]